MSSTPHPSSDRVICPFCRQELPFGGPPQMCGGSFIDRDHPSAVRPILIESREDDAEVEARLAEARATYAR